MTKPICAALATLAVAYTAAPASQAAQMQGMAMGAPAPRTGSATGVVKAVDPKAGTITLQHGPIPAVGWPAMTMAFKAATPAVLHAAKMGATVGFDVRVTGPTAEITAIRPR